MRLETFRIRNCFGFSDSGHIRLSDPSNLVYFLGRNSSGKTSVLRAISYVEWGETPKEKPRFTNYEGTNEEPLLVACFSLDSKADSRLSAEKVAQAAAKPFLDLGMSAVRETDGYQVSGSVANYPARDFPKIAAFLDRVYNAYSELIVRAETAGQIWVEKTADGAYRFLVSEDDQSAYRDRLRLVSEALTSAFDVGQSITVGPSSTVEVPQVGDA